MLHDITWISGGSQPQNDLIYPNKDDSPGGRGNVDEVGMNLKLQEY